MAPEGGGHQVIGRAASILRALEQVPADLRIGDITRGSGLPRAIVIRLVRSLAPGGTIGRRPGGRDCALGTGFAAPAAVGSVSSMVVPG